ncbi:MAG TPA: hypothetical protein VD699_01310 [Nitrosopumilaceae archaeon]|nr:hypothetical protein [Nitrosopumilaceae archaeon]
MVPKGLVIGITVGVVAATIFGALALTISSQRQQLVFVEGPSLSIITEKMDFSLGENIKITIINTGSKPLTFSDASYGLQVVGLDGRILYSPIAAQVVSILEPKEERTFVWDQIKNDGGQVIEGRYKIISSANYEDKTIKKSITINILK